MTEVLPSQKNSTYELSIIVPAFNEAENINVFFTAVTTAFEDFPSPYQIVFIDDGSTDSTFKEMQTIAKRPNLPCEVVAVSFSRNFGKEAALYAGLEYANGSYVSFIDADLQQQPSTLLEMYKVLKANEDADIVAAYQEERRESPLRNWLSKQFYNILASSSNMKVIANASDFRVFTRSVADALLSLTETDRFSKGLFSWIGFNTIPYAYIPSKRVAGISSWSLAKLFRYAHNGLMSFSTFPLKVSTYIGWIAALCAFVYLVINVVKRFVLGVDVPGYATIVVLILFFGSINLLVMGSIGNYLGKTYIQDKKRPIYIARRVITSSQDNVNNE